MVHSFDLRDIPLVTRLEGKGTPLCNELALTRGVHPLRAALAGYVALRKHRTHTCVAAGEAGLEGFAQMKLHPPGEHGFLTYLAPALTTQTASSVWSCLLDALVVRGGELGVQQLIAEVADEGVELDALRQAGFAVYNRQDILRRAPTAVLPELPPGDLPALRPATPTDTWAVQQLYYNTVPRLAQLAESVPSIGQASYVLAEAGELMAYLDMRAGPLGVWLGVMIHPQAEAYARHVLRYGLKLAAERHGGKPVYCCVRRYQEWVREPLLALGFEPFIASVVLVKRLVAPAAEPERAPAHALEARAKIVSPLTRIIAANTQQVTSNQYAPTKNHR